MSEFNLTDKIKSWDEKELVKFSLFCCCKVKHLMNNKSLELVELIEKRLKDETSVSEEELKNAAKAAYNVAFYAASIVYVAANITANTAAHVTYYAVYIAYNTASVAAHAAACVAAYAAEALNVSPESLYLNYMRDILSNIMES